ncbi:putative transmembrane protein ZNF593OS [Vidua macroura]|uniref:putative transmembrane protein ZNF593OS n=1 Tax=Vidua macroura TaxID=187451 RepID=UPI0023A83F84|nr:putative transmembrane protein ZNF593OS [Vidua macroura]
MREAPAQPWSFWGVTLHPKHNSHPFTDGKLRQPHTGLQRGLPIVKPSPSAPPNPPWAGPGPPARSVRSGEQRALIAADSCCSVPARCLRPARGAASTHGAPRRAWGVPAPLLLPQRPDPAAPRLAMIIRPRRLTPGYFHLLQMQLAAGREAEPGGRLLTPLALLLAAAGFCLSLYSARRMADPTKASPEP